MLHTYAMVLNQDAFTIGQDLANGGDYMTKFNNGVEKLSHLYPKEKPIALAARINEAHIEITRVRAGMVRA